MYKQKIYYVRYEDLKHAVEVARDNYDESEFGGANPNEIMAKAVKLRGRPDDDRFGLVKISKIINIIKALETTKFVGKSNPATWYVLETINKKRCYVDEEGNIADV